MTGILMFPVMLLGPSFCRHCVDEDRRRKRRVTGPVLPNLSNTGARRLVYSATDSPSPGPDRSPVSAKIRLTGLCSQPLFRGHPVRHSGRFLGRDRVDGLCIPETALPNQSTGPKHTSRVV